MPPIRTTGKRATHSSIKQSSRCRRSAPILLELRHLIGLGLVFVLRRSRHLVNSHFRGIHGDLRGRGKASFRTPWILTMTRLLFFNNLSIAPDTSQPIMLREPGVLQRHGA